MNASLGTSGGLILTSRTDELRSAVREAGDVVTAAAVIVAQPIDPRAAADHLRKQLPVFRRAQCAPAGRAHPRHLREPAAVRRRCGGPPRSVLFGSTFGLAAGLVAGMFLGWGSSALVGVVAGVVGGVFFSLASGTTGSAWFVFVMACARESRRGRRLPAWGAMGALEDAHSLGLLRAVGPAYQFRHSELQDHLASTPVR